MTAMDFLSLLFLFHLGSLFRLELAPSVLSWFSPCVCVAMLLTSQLLGM